MLEHTNILIIYATVKVNPMWLLHVHNLVWQTPLKSLPQYKLPGNMWIAFYSVYVHLSICKLITTGAQFISWVLNGYKEMKFIAFYLSRTHLQQSLQRTYPAFRAVLIHRPLTPADPKPQLYTLELRRPSDIFNVLVRVLSLSLESSKVFQMSEVVFPRYKCEIR